MSAPAQRVARARVLRLRLLATVLLLLLLCVTATTTMHAHAFRFTVVPGKAKCFTYTVDEPGRYEVHYRMARSLTPFVSVTVTAPNGHVLLEHETAHADAKAVVAVRRPGPLGMCFNTATKAQQVAVSLNVTLAVQDADDAALTRMQQLRYSTSTPIALGVSKAHDSLQVMQDIVSSVLSTRASLSALMRYDTQMRYTFAEIESISLSVLYIFVALALTLTLANTWRLRRAMAKMQLT